MTKQVLSDKAIYEVVCKFYNAISKARRNREFSRNDRMNRFPWGCCDDASDLLAYYLYNEHQIESVQVNGVYRDSNPEHTTNHVWLRLYGALIVDITAIQIAEYTGLSQEVFVGRAPFYDSLEDTKMYMNLDVTKNDRLWNDYLAILKYI